MHKSQAPSSSLSAPASLNRVGRRTSPRAWALTAAFLVVGVVAIAWFDGGEEPLHAITQAVDVPADASLDGEV